MDKMNSYASLFTPLSEVLHGMARLHVELGRMDGHPITTRGWTYNGLVDGCVGIGSHHNPETEQMRAIYTLFDTLDAICEIGCNAVDYLCIWIPIRGDDDDV